MNMERHMLKSINHIATELEKNLVNSFLSNRTRFILNNTLPLSWYSKFSLTLSDVKLLAKSHPCDKDIYDFLDQYYWESKEKLLEYIKVINNPLQQLDAYSINQIYAILKHKSLSPEEFKMVAEYLFINTGYLRYQKVYKYLDKDQNWLHNLCFKHLTNKTFIYEFSLFALHMPLEKQVCAEEIILEITRSNFNSLSSFEGMEVHYLDYTTSQFCIDRKVVIARLDTIGENAYHYVKHPRIVSPTGRTLAWIKIEKDYVTEIQSDRPYTENKDYVAICIKLAQAIGCKYLATYNSQPGHIVNKAKKRQIYEKTPKKLGLIKTETPYGEMWVL